MTLLAVALLTLSACGSAPSAGDVPGDGPCRSESGDEWYFYDDQGRIDRAVIAMPGGIDRAVEVRYHDSRISKLILAGCRVDAGERDGVRDKLADCLADPTTRIYEWDDDTLREAKVRGGTTDLDISYTHVGEGTIKKQSLDPKDGGNPTSYRYTNIGGATIEAKASGDPNARTKKYTLGGPDVSMASCLPMLRGRLGSIGHCLRLLQEDRGALTARKTSAHTIKYTYDDRGRLKAIHHPDLPDTTFDYSCHD